MDQIEELKKVKSLYDSGAITEEDFTKLKQKILGFNTEEAKEQERQIQREEALSEIEKMKAENDAHIAAEQRVMAENEARAAAEQRTITEEEAARQIKYKQAEAEAEIRRAKDEQLNAIEQEKIRGIEEIKARQEQYKQTYSEEKARVAAMAAASAEAKAQRNSELITAGKKAAKVVLQIISWIFMIASLIFMASLMGTGYIFTQIVLLVFAVVICPVFTKYIRKIQWVDSHWWVKTISVIVLIVLLFISIF